MKKALLFGGGVLTGIVLTFIVLAIIGSASSNNGGLIGAKMFDAPGDVVSDREFKVLQAVEDHAALAHAKEKDRFYESYSGTLYLIINNDGKYYYDEEIIKVPAGKVVRQVGIYNYTSKAGVGKTVPIIQIMN